MRERLPIDDVLGDVGDALASAGVAVLHAPPGAGKTTRVPLALLDAPWLHDRRIIMLEPRRIAARAAASYMAASRGEGVGHAVGYRVHLDTRVSADTRIEVVTEGVLTRMLQHDPALDGVGLVIFDEFHERSIHADLGLALTLHTRALFRPDLRILVMSATLDTAPIARALGDAPVINTHGRAWPVETHFLPRPVQGHVDTATARATLDAMADHEGDVLVFLPGAAEIRRAAAMLTGAVDGNTDVYPLHGQLPQPLQDRAIAASPAGRRKIVLATSIAQTSLTIDGVRVVVDSGLMRVPRFSARTGMSRLETVRVTRSAAEQRCGRAGRTAPGVCYRMWSAAEDAGLVPHDTPEILETDLAPLALDLALWGVRDPGDLVWLDAPPHATLQHARELLTSLHAIQDDGDITPHGRALSELPLHPRLAHMIIHAASLGLDDIACDVAALLNARDIFPGHMRDPDLRIRIDALHNNSASLDRSAVERVRHEATQLRARLRHAHVLSTPSNHADANVRAARSEYAGLLLAFAYPDRIAQRRTTTRAAGTGTNANAGMRSTDNGARYLMRNGRGATSDVTSSMGMSEFVAIATLDDAGTDARIQLAAPLDRADIETYFAEDITSDVSVVWDDAADAARSLRTRSLGALILEQVRVTPTDTASHTALLVAAIRKAGIAALPWTDDTTALLQRIRFARTLQPDVWPDTTDAILEATLDDWLLPFITNAQKLADVTDDAVRTALHALLGYAMLRDLDAFAPPHYVAPTGSRVAIDYNDPAAPAVDIRLQEMFGEPASPRVGNGTVALTLRLLSPANRPVQVTRDLAGFWTGSYADVRKEMRGRYPRHDWPLDPANATPSRRPRPRPRG